MRKTLFTLLASAALLSIVPVAVQAEIPTAAAPDAATQRKVVLVKRYLAAVHFDELMDNMFNQMLPAIAEAARRQSPGINAEQSKIIMATAGEVMSEFMPEYMEDVTLLYAETFTEEELTQLVSFYEGPVGQSIMMKTNAMMPKVTELMVAKMPDLQSKMMTRMCAKIDCKSAKPAG